MSRGKRIRANRLKQQRKQHGSIMGRALQDDVQLCVALEERFKDLMASHIRIKGVILEVPKSLDKEMILWRTVAVRFKKGDYRINRDEILAIRALCEWTIIENHSLRGQEGEPEIPQWKD